MSNFQTTPKLPAGKIKRRGMPRGYFVLKQVEGQPDEILFVKQVGKRNAVRNARNRVEGELVTNQGIVVEETGRIGNVRSHSRGKLLGGRVQTTRTGPEGRKAMVSPDAIDSIAESMEKSTRSVIAKIGKSIGF